ncbi:hypothetical protein QAD02_017340 [Eretmocerus hayati]|uniref:Uncharacterized protein n=1 Tax=Eretmocerus hayati TaxID=131215 RepID=A0ACC2PDK9_9HYME|nr:hypothetical protein QAD02_017340 [Eretmocerus hayati]
MYTICTPARLGVCCRQERLECGQRSRSRLAAAAAVERDSARGWPGRARERRRSAAEPPRGCGCNHGSQCTRQHGQGRTEEADREHEVPGQHGAVAPLQEHRRIERRAPFSHCSHKALETTCTGVSHTLQNDNRDLTRLSTT